MCSCKRGGNKMSVCGLVGLSRECGQASSASALASASAMVHQQLFSSLGLSSMILALFFPPNFCIGLASDPVHRSALFLRLCFGWSRSIPPPSLPPPLRPPTITTPSPLFGCCQHLSLISCLRVVGGSLFKHLVILVGAPKKTR